MPRKKRSDQLIARLKTAQMLFFVDTFVWLCLTIHLLTEMLRQNNGLSVILPGFFLGLNVLGMFLSGKYIGKGEKWAYYLGLVVLVFGCLVNLTGQFGWIDWFAFIFNIMLVVFLASFRQAYLGRS
jgi:hypothetical protein